MGKYLNDILIFCSVFILSLLILRLMIRSSMEHMGKSVQNKNDQLCRFIQPQKMFLLRVNTGIIMFCLSLIILLLAGVEKMTIALPCSCGIAVFSVVLVKQYFLRKVRQRQREIQQNVLNLTMGLVNCMKSGLGLGQALDSIAKRMHGYMQEELRQLLQEHRLGLSLDEAFERFYQRAPSEDLHLLVTTISLTMKSGGSMVEVLEQMVDTIRSRTEFEERLLNMTAQGRFEAMVLSSIPVLAFFILYFIDPELMIPLVTTEIGWCAVGVVTILVLLGYYATKKIITVKV